MFCRISYFSPQGHARELAYLFRRLFPSNTQAVDIMNGFFGEETLHIIGFEFHEPACEQIPDIVKKFVNELTYKELLFFATCPVCPDPKIREQIEGNLISILPETCKYSGLYLCQGEVRCEVLDTLAKNVSCRRGDAEAQMLLRQYRKGRGHPNREDIRNGYRYLAAALQLESF